MYNTGKIFNIQRFSTSDGPGIRTVVFFKGCPLNCEWCHNPESKSAKPDIFYRQDVCIGCGHCVDVCANTCHSLIDGLHLYEREKCSKCGKCANICSANALEICGEEKTTEEIIDIVLRDRNFYEESGGGITLSGGEPLQQYDFALSLLKLAKSNQLNTAIETSGFSNKDLTELNQYVDLWLYDIKLLSNPEHIKYTGVSNEIILENLRLLDRIGANIILRCPIIPNINMTFEHFDALGEIANKFSNITEINLEPYHPLGHSKASQLGKIQIYKNEEFLEISKIEPFVKYLQSKTNIPTIVI